MPVEQKETAPEKKLAGGEVLYWHHLVRNGEIPGVEDLRTRYEWTPQNGKAGVSVVAFDR
jgi:hypothetical protein